MHSGCILNSTRCEFHVRCPILSLFCNYAFRSCSCEARVYEQPNFQGRSVLIQQQNANLDNNFFDDRTDSIFIIGQCDWIFYQCQDFIGRAHVLKSGNYASPPSWGGKGHEITSARALPEKGTTAISLFEHVNYRGRMLILYDSEPDMRFYEFDNEVSSVIITGGSWTLYEQSEYTGKSSNLTVGQYPILQYLKIGQDTLSSVSKN